MIIFQKYHTVNLELVLEQAVFLYESSPLFWYRYHYCYILYIFYIISYNFVLFYFLEIRTLRWYSLISCQHWWLTERHFCMFLLKNVLFFAAFGAYSSYPTAKLTLRKLLLSTVVYSQLEMPRFSR